MKKKIICLSVVTIMISTVLWFINIRKIPIKVPKTTILINGKEYKTVLGERLWLSKSQIKKGGSSFLVAPNEAFNKCSFIEANSNNILNFKTDHLNKSEQIFLSYSDTSENPYENKYEIKKDYEYVDNNNCQIILPNKEGYYYYSLSIKWDDTHAAEYFFKVEIIG